MNKQEKPKLGPAQRKKVQTLRVLNTRKIILRERYERYIKLSAKYDCPPLTYREWLRAAGYEL